jgi:polysaccharide biosynthesis protein PslH
MITYGLLVNIVLLTPFEPAAFGGGAQQRAAGHLRSLAALGNVHLVIVSDKPAKSCLEPDLAGLCASIRHVPHAPKMMQRRSFTGQFPGAIASLRFALSFPPEQGYVPEPDECREIIGQLGLPEASLLFAFRVKTAWWAEAIERAGQRWPARRIVDFDDIDSQARWRSLFTDWRKSGPLTNLMLAVQAFKTSRIEAALLRRWDLVTIASGTAERALKRQYPYARVQTLPNRVFAPEMPASLPERGEKLRLLFVGSFGHPPNVTALIWFINRVLPRVQSNGQAVTIVVVGSNPDEQIRAFAAAGKVELHANVPSVSAFYQSADAIIVPLLDGSGTRIKILEAMAHCRPVISTPIGAEGLDLVHEHDLLIAKSPRDFAQSINRIGASVDLARKLAVNGFNRVKATYNSPLIEALEQRLVLDVLQGE